MKHVAMRYCEARPLLADGDVLLFRSRGLIWSLIAVGGRSCYTHAAMAGRWRRRVMCVEMTGGGGRAQALSNLVEQWPGKIDVYRAKGIPSVKRLRALDYMIDVTARPYGSWNLARAAVLHLPLIRCFVSPSLDDSEDDCRPQFCSQAIASAYRSVGYDLVPNLSDRLTEPGDLARSAMLEYQFTLI